MTEKDWLDFTEQVRIIGNEIADNALAGHTDCIGILAYELSSIATDIQAKVAMQHDHKQVPDNYDLAALSTAVTAAGNNETAWGKKIKQRH